MARQVGKIGIGLAVAIVLSASLHLPGFASDREAYKENLLTWGKDLDGPGVDIGWMGAAGLYITDGETALLIDPFVSRESLWHGVFGLPVEPDVGLVSLWKDELGIDRVEGIIVTHSHHDHSMDAGEFQKATGGQVLGSASTALIAAGSVYYETPTSPDAGRCTTGPAVPPLVVQTRKAYSCGNFEVTFLRGTHGRQPVVGVPYPGIVEQKLIPPQPFSAYRLGQVYAVVVEHRTLGTILHVGSAGQLLEEIPDLTGDVVAVLGVNYGSKDSTRTYIKNTARAAKAGMVAAFHFDSIFAKLDPTAPEIEILPHFRLSRFLRIAKEQMGDAEVVTLPLAELRRVLPIPGK
ncbi:MAG: MBL fold metallo-hydrolase [Pseudomonadota bacterium]